MADAFSQDDAFSLAPDSAAMGARAETPASPPSTDQMLDRRIQTSLDREQAEIDSVKRSMQTEEELQRKRADTLAPLRQRQMEMASRPLPEPPQMEQAPKPPQQRTHEDENWIFTAGLLGSLAGAFTRRHVTNALAAFSGAIEGYTQGSREKFDQNMKVWEAENKRVLEQNGKALERYRSILESRKLSADQISTQLQIAAAEFDDEAMATAARSKNGIVIAQLYDKQAAAAQQLKSSGEALQQKHEEMKTRERVAELRAVGINNPQQLAEMVDAIGQYRTAPLRGRAGMAVMEEVYKKYKDYDEGKWLDHKLRSQIPGRAEAALETSEARTTGTRIANLDLLIRNTTALIPVALEQSKGVPRSSFLHLNELLQTADSAIGDPALKEFKSTTLNVIELWAKSMNPNGAMTVEYFRAAKEMLSTVDSPEAYQKVLLNLDRLLRREYAAGQAQKAHEPLPELGDTGGGSANTGAAIGAVTGRAGNIIKNEIGVPPGMGLPPGAAGLERRSPPAMSGDMPVPQLPEGWKAEQVQ